MPVAWERDGDIGVAIIDRPERRNALSAELCEELLAHIETASDARAVVIGGAGDQAFCSGADLGRRAADTAGGLEHGGGDAFRPAFEALLDGIVAHRGAVIAAVNGLALGAGMQLAVACDLRVVSPRATFGIPAGRLGVMLSPANVSRLAILVGQAMARDLLFTSRTLDVEEASRCGLVQRRADDALASARELAHELAELAPLSIAGHKRALNVVAARQMPDSADREELLELEARAFASKDLEEGLAAFADKRTPRFSGE